MDAALSGAELLSALFRIRAGALLGESSADPAAYASGLLIGCDVREGLARAPAASRVTLVGRPDLTALYSAAIGRRGHATASIDGAEAFLTGIRLIVGTM